MTPHSLDATTLAARDGLPPEARGWAMVSVAIGVGMASLDTAIANTALPAIADQLRRPARRR